MVSGTDTLTNRTVVAFGFGHMRSLCYEVHLDIEIVHHVFEEDTEFVVPSNAFDVVVRAIKRT